MENNNNNFNYCPGSMIQNSNTQEKYGSLIRKIGDKLFFFRLENDTIPVFSKMDLIPCLEKNGHINQECNSKLKNELLRYYRTRNLGENEKVLLHQIMKFAFPNGIPKHHSQINITNEKLKELDLSSSLDNGNQLLLNTHPNSSICSLNNKKVYVIEKTPNGLWVVIPESNINDSRFHYIYYKDKSIPNFTGVTNIQSLDNNLNTDDYNTFYNLFKEHPKTCDIQHNGCLIKILPEDNSVIYPNKFRNHTYSPLEDSLINRQKEPILQEYDDQLDNIVLNDNNNDEDNNDEDNSNDNYNDNYNDEDNDKIKNICMKGGAKINNDKKELNQNNIMELYKKDEIQLLSDEDDEVYFNDEELKFMKSQNKKKKKRNDSQSSVSSDESSTTTDEEFDDDDFEEADFDDNFDVVEVIDKDIIQEKKEKDKNYSESLQISQLNKIFINQYPFLLRNNQAIKDKVVKKVNQFINLKNNVLFLNNNEEDESKPNFSLDKESIKPLLIDYKNGNYNNKFLVPLVLNTKKIY